MGLKLRLNVFDGVDAPDVFGALAEFHGKRGAKLVEERERQRRYDLYRRQGRWCVLDWDAGWEWQQRREAELFVSERLATVGLLVFVDDGDYWGYELFREGQVLDRFLQSPDEGLRWFAGDPSVGNAGTLAAALGLPEADVAPYLVRQPDDEDPDQAEWQRLDVPARPGDEFTRFAECAVLDFMRAVGVDVALRESYVRFGGEVWRSFRPSF